MKDGKTHPGRGPAGVGRRWQIYSDVLMIWRRWSWL